MAHLPTCLGMKHKFGLLQFISIATFLILSMTESSATKSKDKRTRNKGRIAKYSTSKEETKAKRSRKIEKGESVYLGYASFLSIKPYSYKKSKKKIKSISDALDFIFSKMKI